MPSDPKIIKDLILTFDSLSEQRAERMLDELAIHFNIPKPRLNWTNHAKNGRAWNLYNKVALGPNCWRGTTNSLLHEFAHILDWQRQRKAIEAAGYGMSNVVLGHGMSFVRALVDVVGFWFRGDLSRYGWVSEYKSISNYATRSFACGSQDNEKLYVVIDVTSLRDCRIVCVCNLAKAAKFWEWMKGQGRKLIGPSVESFESFESGLWRSSSGLGEDELRALYKNEMNKKPPEDLMQLVEAIAGIVERKPVDNSFDTMPEIVRKGRQPRAEGEPASRPQTGVTKQVWEIADKVIAEIGTPKDLRSQIIAACEDEGINAATAATQYSKWNKARHSK